MCLLLSLTFKISLLSSLRKICVLVFNEFDFSPKSFVIMLLFKILNILGTMSKLFMDERLEPLEQFVNDVKIEELLQRFIFSLEHFLDSSFLWIFDAFLRV